MPQMIVDPDFVDHWKTRMLVGLLGGDEVAPVYVLRLWSHCQNRRQSTFQDFSTEALKALCRYSGPANKLEGALVASGFIRRVRKSVVALGWDAKNAQLIASWKNGSKGGRPPNGTETQGLPTGGPDPSSLLYSSLISELVEGTTFNTEHLKCALTDWCAHFERRLARKIDDVKLRNDLMVARRNGWSADKLESSIRFSISKDAKSWIDPSNDLDAKNKSGRSASVKDAKAGL